MLESADGVVAITYEFVSVAGNDSQSLRSEVEVDTVHNGTKLLVSGSKDSTCDIVCKDRRLHCKTCHVVVDRQTCWILLSILCCEVVDTILINHLYRHCLQVNVESERLLRQLLYSVKDCLVVNSKLSFTVGRVESDACTHHVLAVGSGDDELLVIYFKQETVENSQTVFAIDYL